MTKEAVAITSKITEYCLILDSKAKSGVRTTCREVFPIYCRLFPKSEESDLHQSMVGITLGVADYEAQAIISRTLPKWKITARV